MLLVNIYFFTFRNDEELEEYDKMKVLTPKSISQSRPNWLDEHDKLKVLTFILSK